MNYKQLFIAVFYLVWKPLLQSLIIITLLLFVERSIWTILLSILSVSLSFKLFEEPPVVKDWFKSIGFTVLFVVFVYGIVWLFGAEGLLGSILLLLGFAGWRIYLGWNMFDAVITWGAERLKGKHDKNFDIDKIRGAK